MEHPIHDLLKISLESVKEMIDVNTIVGKAIENDGKTIIPVSKVKFGFATGGTEMKSGKSDSQRSPFGGGTGGSVSITPSAFLVINKDEVDVLALDNQTHLYEKLINKVPNVFDNLKRKAKSNNVIDTI